MAPPDYVFCNNIDVDYIEYYYTHEPFAKQDTWFKVKYTSHTIISFAVPHRHILWDQRVDWRDTGGQWDSMDLPSTWEWM